MKYLGEKTMPLAGLARNRKKSKCVWAEGSKHGEVRSPDAF